MTGRPVVRAEAEETGRATVQAVSTGDRVNLPTAMGNTEGFQHGSDDQTRSGSHLVTVVFRMNKERYTGIDQVGWSTSLPGK